jgi:hypothetical protein
VIARGWSRWVALLATREPATSLALTRIALGLALVAHVAHMLASGIDALAWTDRAYGGFRVLDATPFPQATPGLARWIALATIASGIAFTTGTYTRLATLATWLGFRWLGDLNGHAGGSYDEVFLDVLFVLLWSGCGEALSVDAWRARRAGTPPALVPAWPRWVVVGQLVTIYASTGLQKVSAAWLPVGPRDALWYILQQPDWQRRAFALPAWTFPLTQAATAFTWVWEVGAPVLLLTSWWRRTRTRGDWLRAQSNRVDLRAWWLGAGVVLHLGIEALLEVGGFSWAMLSLYACAWHPDEWAALTRRLRGARGTTPPP